MPRRRRSVARVLSCCGRKKQTLSDSDEEFTNVLTSPNQPLRNEYQEFVPIVDLSDTPTGEAWCPDVSSGSLPGDVEVKNIEIDGENNSKEIVIQNREIQQPEINSVSSEEVVQLKAVHFSTKEPHIKDTRDKYRQTPVKRLSANRHGYVEESVFLRDPREKGLIEVSISELKRQVNEYVKKILESAYEVFIKQELRDGNEALERLYPDPEDDLNTTTSSDDGIGLNSSQESDLIENMIDTIITDVTKSLDNSQNTTDKPKTSEDNATTSSSDASTLTSEVLAQIESLSSLEWDAYTPLLREDPSYTDVTTTLVPPMCPEISAGTEE